MVKGKGGCLELVVDGLLSLIGPPFQRLWGGERKPQNQRKGKYPPHCSLEYKNMV